MGSMATQSVKVRGVASRRQGLALDELLGGRGTVAKMPGRRDSETLETGGARALSPTGPDHDAEQLRLMTRVAWLYHMRGFKQSLIADTLDLSQSRVSRLLDSAVAQGIVHTTVQVPPGLQLELEQALQESYGLESAHVFDVPDPNDERSLLRDLGQMLAVHLREQPLVGDVIGLTSWSRTLRETVRSLDRMSGRSASFVVELLGDVGNPEVQHEAAEVTRQLARITGAEPRFLRVPGVTPSGAVRASLLDHDVHAQETLALHDRLDEALVGIGACTMDLELGAGDSSFAREQFDHARALGAVGEVNLRFIDAEGNAVASDLDDLVIGVTLEQLRRCPRRIAVAGGRSKYDAVRGSLRGGWINSLVTDVRTAQHLVETSSH